MFPANHVLDIAAPAEVRRYVVLKGSISADGISLTVAGVTKTGLRIWIIPHTLAVTALRERKVGDAVNLEAALRDFYVVQRGPWVETHGYPHAPATRATEAALRVRRRARQHGSTLGLAGLRLPRNNGRHEFPPIRRSLARPWRFPVAT